MSIRGQQLEPTAMLVERLDRDDESNAPFNIRVTTTLLLLATLFVGLRFLARHMKNISYGPEDWTCLAALVSNALYRLERTGEFERVGPATQG